MQNNSKVLFQQLLSMFEELADIWNDYHKGEMLSHFDGFSTMHYLESTLLDEALWVIKTLHSEAPHEEMSKRIARIKEDFSLMNNPYNEYLLDVPEKIESIAYFFEGFFNDFCNAQQVLDEQYIEKLLGYSAKLLEEKV